MYRALEIACDWVPFHLLPFILRPLEPCILDRPRTDNLGSDLVPEEEERRRKGKGRKKEEEVLKRQREGREGGKNKDEERRSVG